MINGRSIANSSVIVRAAGAGMLVGTVMVSSLAGTSVVVVVSGGAVVVVTHPGQGQLMIKRLSAPCNGGWWVLGDNPASSSDSRQFGPIAATAIRAIATAVVPSKG